MSHTYKGPICHLSTGVNDPNKCRWCWNYHGPQCPSVKAIEFHADGVTVKRVEYITYADYPPLNVNGITPFMADGPR